MEVWIGHVFLSDLTDNWNRNVLFVENLKTLQKFQVSKNLKRNSNKNREQKDLPDVRSVAKIRQKCFQLTGNNLFT